MLGSTPLRARLSRYLRGRRGILVDRAWFEFSDTGETVDLIIVGEMHSVPVNLVLSYKSITRNTDTEPIILVYNLQYLSSQVYHPRCRSNSVTRNTCEQSRPWYLRNTRGLIQTLNRVGGYDREINSHLSKYPALYWFAPM